MSLIETAEGQTLIASREPSNPSLRFEARLSTEGEGGRYVTVDERVYSVYSISADVYDGPRPCSRGDLTADVMEDFANRLVGWAVAERDVADRRADVVVESIEIYERDDAQDARAGYAPDWEDDWPADGSASEKIRFIANHDVNFSEEQVAAAVGCSRSLVRDVRDRM